MAHACLDWREVASSNVPSTVAHRIDPLLDPRWNDFVDRHPLASVFHSTAWLTALSRTYGYKPIAYTTSRPGEHLENSLVFCRVKSWLTGRRLVSLPFSDHCEPLVSNHGELEVLTEALEQECRAGRWKYLELRPLRPVGISTLLCRTEVPYVFHQLDLEPGLDRIFSNFHKSSIQRKIRRAEREGLIYSEGSTPALLQQFFELVKITRKRQKLPPQSWGWFSNLASCFGESLKIRVARKADQPVAAMLTIRHKETLVYKYGCSDSRLSRLGGTHMLFWMAIQEAKTSGLRFLDFGRCDAGQQGLITFKNRWGATQSALTYVRYGAAATSTHIFDLYAREWKSKAIKSVLSYLPSPILSMIGKVAYRHAG